MESNSENPLRNIVASEMVYEGAIIDVRVDRVKFPSGALKKREVVLHRPAVAILAVDEAERILLVSQYRHAIDETLLEIPAGIVEDGELPWQAAVRELQEEIGFKPGQIKELFTLYASPGFSNEEIIFFYAADLAKSKLPEDDDEYIKVETYTLDEVAGLIAQGRLRDGKAVIAYYWYLHKRASQCR